ncbi:hypothetical protein AAG906_011240 [Vitis piasezkii]
MNFMSYEHLVEECPTIPMVREMFGDCNTYNSNWRDHPNFSWKPQPPQDKQHKSINAHLSQRIDSVESSLNKRMDEVQNDLSQKIDNLQDSISRFANLNTVQEKGNFPSQPYQNSKGIHEVEAQKGESSMVKEVKTVITLSTTPKQANKRREAKRKIEDNSCSLISHFWSTSQSPFSTFYIPFQSSGSKESNASNRVRFGAEMRKIWPMEDNCSRVCEMFAQHLQNSHTCVTWPPSYEMASKLQNDMQKHFAKPREIAKMPTESHNHASKEESPLTEITHEVSHSISYLLKPSKLIASTESSS